MMDIKTKPLTDPLISEIADYVSNPVAFSRIAYDTALYCLADSLGCAILALKHKACSKLLGPIVDGTEVPAGTRIPGTNYILDPIQAAFNIGTMIRWLDYNDTWLAAEWGHPSDNLGALLALTDYLSQKHPIPVKTLLEAMIKAYEIQGILALDNSFNRIGFDHVLLVKVASAAVSMHLWDGSKPQIEDVLANAFIDTGPLRTYRHAPNTGSRKSWAAGDATRRGLELAWFVKRGEMGYPSALSAKTWGFNDIMLPVTLARPLNGYVMENILFKISYPAEFHAQTAVEAAIILHPKVRDQLDHIKEIHIATHESALRIIDKRGPLYNPADRDHCLQYMVAIALIKGGLTADDYEEDAASNPLIDKLREKMKLTENPQFSKDYLDPRKRSIANSITIIMDNGTIYGPFKVEYPLGHRKRRHEAEEALFSKFKNNLLSHYDIDTVLKIEALFHDKEKILEIPVHEMVNYFLTGKYRT